MRAVRSVACRRSSSDRTRPLHSTRGFRVTPRPASPTNLKWAEGNGSQTKCTTASAPCSWFYSTRPAPGWRGRGQAAAGAQLAALRSVAGATSGDSPLADGMVRLESWLATATGAGATFGSIRASRAMGAVGPRFGDSLRAPESPADALWHCPGVGPRSRTVGHCAPLGCRRDRNGTLLALLGPARGFTGVADRSSKACWGSYIACLFIPAHRLSYIARGRITSSPM